MSKQTYTLQIDALAAYRQIGVNLHESKIGQECANALEVRLTKSVTTVLLAECLLEATKKQKTKRTLRKSGLIADQSKTGGSGTNEA